MKATIKKLIKKQDKLYDKLVKVDNAIAALQEVCKHKFIQTGNDSHYKYYECKYCKLKDKV